MSRSQPSLAADIGTASCARARYNPSASGDSRCSFVMNSMIYLDYAATTPVDPRVFEAMRPYFADAFGNPSSIHRYGQQAEAAVESALESVAGVLGCQPDEIVFTSCGSESDNLALRGAALAMREKGGANRIVTSRAEH